MSKESPETKPKDYSILTDVGGGSWLKAVGTVLLTLGIFFLGQLIPVILVVTALNIAGQSSDEITTLLSGNIAAQLIVTILIAAWSVFLIWAFLKWRGHKPLDFLMLKKVPTGSQLLEVILLYGVYFLTLIAASVIVSLLIPAVDVNQSQELGVAETSGNGLIAVFIMLAVIPPIFEEILFRGFLYKYLRKFGGIILAYIVTSVIFGAAHLEFGNLNWIAAIDTLIFSGFLIYISQKHASLYSAIFLHAIKNSIAFVVLFVL